ncbi:unnamed protein product [Cladocopium goreaui]|uniref:Uncharacterized protein n=1 Tax=Cladocopium goreaui TaxID=2562237 RepID=A0A9P1CXD1_9DINO|nr:unnamed protein product [Cladocopium goreaui]
MTQAVNQKAPTLLRRASLRPFGETGWLKALPSLELMSPVPPSTMIGGRGPFGETGWLKALPRMESAPLIAPLAVDEWFQADWYHVLALVLQSGWLHGLLASFLGTAVTLSLRATELIEDPWHNVLLLLDNTQFASPLSFWTVLISGLSMVLGLCLSPLLPFKTQMCYLDAACIHLGQGELFERGIYSIAGSFSVAEEMRVLYSEQYLSSLWCLFELVGYHKANPEGRLVFKPLFIERSAAICTFFIWCFAFSINFAVTYTAEGFRQEYIGVMYLVTFLLPLILLVHFMRRNYREKARLIFDLKNFELDRTTCASEFDRSFILSAIEAWYGTRENFQNYVRGHCVSNFFSCSHRLICPAAMWP